MILLGVKERIEGLRAQIEAVRIHKDRRGEKIGRSLFEWAIHRARSRGTHVLQMTSDKARPSALAFHESLGFAATHEGMKMHLLAPFSFGTCL
ncbi:MAG: GNAT family N-acetyltransferase [Saprospiraceae bacterium]|nr:GNAT family N-acetyltransferase [Saprospiraceae bacterium]